MKKFINIILTIMIVIPIVVIILPISLSILIFIEMLNQIKFSRLSYQKFTLKYANIIFELVCEDLNIKPCEFIMDSLYEEPTDENYHGSCSVYGKWVRLNNSNIYKKYNGKIISIISRTVSNICHETRHLYQVQNNLLPNKQDYVLPENSFADYLAQNVEKDANSYSRKMSLIIFIKATIKILKDRV